MKDMYKLYAGYFALGFIGMMTFFTFMIGAIALLMSAKTVLGVAFAVCATGVGSAVIVDVLSKEFIRYATKLDSKFNSKSFSYT